MNIVFQVTGGIYPGHYRSTSVEVLTDDVELGNKSISNWGRINFPDWNHISKINSHYALYTINPISTIPVFKSRKR